MYQPIFMFLNTHFREFKDEKNMKSTKMNFQHTKLGRRKRGLVYKMASHCVQNS